MLGKGSCTRGCWAWNRHPRAVVTASSSGVQGVFGQYFRTYVLDLGHYCVESGVGLKDHCGSLLTQGFLSSVSNEPMQQEEIRKG